MCEQVAQLLHLIAGQVHPDLGHNGGVAGNVLERLRRGPATEQKDRPDRDDDREGGDTERDDPAEAATGGGGWASRPSHDGVHRRFRP